MSDPDEAIKISAALISNCLGSTRTWFVLRRFASRALENNGDPLEALLRLLPLSLQISSPHCPNSIGKALLYPQILSLRSMLIQGFQGFLFNNLVRYAWDDLFGCFLFLLMRSKS